ncbi:tryptophan synthase subunit alpha [Candidatus Marinarcus aquaticus]|uniref:Tryptophan synthase alpha chain n=1 Tax=Candidatus Marinarcus aquaticus TaxID=2044504 RepID=A0A4Q0XQE8_9BACT|nr:tryptophan synthase subunit alpha [Candidatus Marinarcus aquaticus]RXJ56289.1 tryptophan synthase subunit alpha [Candidatus Marinarcus aquaticus]
MKKLVGYITTAFPSKDFTVDLSFSMAEAGVDTLELGIPFSDPVADGPVIEKANLISLQNGFKMKDLFEVTEQIAPKIDTLWMGYMNTFYHQGMETIVKKAQALGLHGAIIPDLPYEETKSYSELFKAHEQALISFVAPTDTKERIATIVKDAQKFIYLVAYAGITGSGKSEDLTQVIEYTRQSSDTPIYIGFGVDETTAKSKAKGVDGVIVGSAFVKILLDETLNHTEKIKRVSSLAKEIKEKINE